MTDVDVIVWELAEVQRQLLGLGADEFAERHRLLVRRDELREQAAAHGQDLDEERTDEDLRPELVERRRQLEAIERQRIDLVMQSGTGSHGAPAASDGWGAVEINRRIDQAQDVEKLRARIGRLASSSKIAASTSRTGARTGRASSGQG